MSRRAALRPYPPPFQSTGPLSTGSTKKDALRRCSTLQVDGTCDLRLRAHIRLSTSDASDFLRREANADLSTDEQSQIFQIRNRK
jgi:hypothetical protein